MRAIQIIPFFAIFALFYGCTIEHAEEQIVATHANGVKKTSIWTYPDGEILKRNEWYNDGIKELEIPYKDSVPHGEFKRWTGFGDLVMVGEYRKGKRHGKWTSYFGGHFNKKTEAIRYYENDHPVGDWTGWHFNGEKAFEEHYSDNGDTVGVWERWYENGKLAERNSCHHLDSIGFIEEFYENGKRRQYTACSFGVFNGEHTEYTADEKNEPILRESYRNGILNGERILLYKREHWNDGVRDSVWRWEDDRGNLIRESEFTNGTGIAYGHCEDNLSALCAETSFVANVPGGSLDSLSRGTATSGATLWYRKKDHNLRYEEIWLNGEIAESRSFYPDSLGGKMASQGFWKNSKRDGIWRNWYKNGTLRDSLSFVDGEQVGEQFSYDSTGRMTIHKTTAGKKRPVIMHIPGTN